MFHAVCRVDSSMHFDLYVFWLFLNCILELKPSSEFITEAIIWHEYIKTEPVSSTYRFQLKVTGLFKYQQLVAMWPGTSWRGGSSILYKQKYNKCLLCRNATWKLNKYKCEIMGSLKACRPASLPTKPASQGQTKNNWQKSSLVAIKPLLLA